MPSGARVRDGAMARWRTLHEIAAWHLFLHSTGRPWRDDSWTTTRQLCDAAKCYRAHADRWDASRCQTRVRDDRFFCEAVVAKYGERSRSPLVGRRRHSSESANMAKLNVPWESTNLRPYYKDGQYNVHADPRGTFF